MNKQNEFENMLLIQVIITGIAIILFCLFANVSHAEDTISDDYLCKIQPNIELCGYETGAK